MARAPEAIQHLWRDIYAGVPRAKLSGIVGDVHHSFGYHLARNELPRSDYSVQLSKDRLGKGDCASALDVSLPPDLMKVCTQRLLSAAKARDPRLRALREFCGTLNGSQTYPWDLSSNSSEGVNSWDNSHLWHIHLSFYREFADDYAALAPIAQVFAGTGSAQKEDEVSEQDVINALNSSAGQAAIAKAVLTHPIKIWNGSQPTMAALLSGTHRYASFVSSAVTAKTGVLNRVAALQASIAGLKPAEVEALDVKAVAAAVTGSVVESIKTLNWKASK